MGRPTNCHIKNTGKIAAELRLLWPILRRWPNSYSFGEYLQAVEQHQVRLRARPADNIARQSLPWGQHIVLRLRIRVRSKEITA